MSDQKTLPQPWLFARLLHSSRRHGVRRAVARMATQSVIPVSIVQAGRYPNKIKDPLLLIQADNNSGTFPIQSERMFQAIKGSGATARMVILPCESHGYQARESVLHVLAKMFEWADKYVKNRAMPASG